MAEREGFEPPVALRLRLISSQVHSTALPPLQLLKLNLLCCCALQTCVSPHTHSPESTGEGMAIAMPDLNPGLASRIWKNAYVPIEKTLKKDRLSRSGGLGGRERDLRVRF